MVFILPALHACAGPNLSLLVHAAQSVAQQHWAGLAANASLTKILVSRNKLGNEGAAVLCDALRESTVTKVQELDLSFNAIGPDGAKAVAAMAAVVGSLTRLNVKSNDLGDEGRAIISSAVQGKVGFDLSLRGEYE